MAGGRGKKKQENPTKTRTSPRKQKTPADEEEERPTQEEELATGSQEGDRAVTGTGEELEEKTQPLGDPFTQEQEEQIVTFFEEHKCYYDMADVDYKNQKREHLLLEFARSMFTSGKCIFSFKYFS